MKFLSDFLFASILFDAPEHYQFSFQDAASSLGEEIIWFHDRLLFYFVLIATVVLWMITQIVLSFRLKNRAITHKYLVHGTALEIIWTLTPALILVTIAFPSFKLLYLMDEVIDPSITIKAIGLIYIYREIVSLILNDGLKFINFSTLIYLPICHNHYFKGAYSTNFIKVNIRADKRIGPHNIDVVSVVFGSLLGDGYANKRTIDGVRICYRQSIKHKKYLDWLYNFFYERGYVSNLPPRIYNRILKKSNKIYQGYEFNTFTFKSFFWIHKLFYSKGKKILPNKEYLDLYLTPLALAIWIMDDGCFVKSGVRIATNNFTKQEHEIIIQILKLKYDLDCTIQTIDNRHSVYIRSNSLNKLRKIVDPYILSNMKYKIGLGK